LKDTANLAMTLAFDFEFDCIGQCINSERQTAVATAAQ